MKQLAPERLQHLGVEDDPRLHRIGMVRAEILAHLGQLEVVSRDLGQRFISHKRPQHTPQPRRVHTNRGRELIARPHPLSNPVGHAEPDRHVQQLRRLRTIRQPQQIPLGSTDNVPRLWLPVRRTRHSPA